MPTYVILLGMPGAGKGTQAQMIAQELNLPHISSGNLFRQHISEMTPLGEQAKLYIDRGELVPDDLTISMIRERLCDSDCARGALLDGFPRTPAQAVALESLLKEFSGQVNVVPMIRVAEEDLLERLTGRWTCRAKGHIFHQKYNPSKEPMICDIDGSELYQRKDDEAETVKNRIEVYLEQTKPLINYYKDKSLLFEINGAQSIEKVNADLLAVIRDRL